MAGVGEFFDEYLDVLDAEQVLDYAELVHRSRILLAEPDAVAALRAEIAAVFVDEYQDTDPAQVRLLQAIAGDGRDVVVVGDPDQSVYGFRGAEARGLLDFPDPFRTVARDAGADRALWARREGSGRPCGGQPQHRQPAGLPRALPPAVLSRRSGKPVVAPGAARGRVEALTCTTAGAEAEQIAELLRDAHLRDGLDWAEMAVLVRSGKRMIPGLSRALTAAGVPVEVAGDEIPLGGRTRRPAAAAGAADRPPRLPADPDEARVPAHLGTGRAGQHGLAAARPSLREAERTELAGAGLPRLSAELVGGRRLAIPICSTTLEPGPEVDAAARLADLLARCAARIRAGDSAEEALWMLWSGTDWPERLRRQAALGGEVRAAGQPGPGRRLCPVRHRRRGRTSWRAGAGSPASWPRWRASRSRPTPCGSPSCAARPYGC